MGLKRLWERVQQELSENSRRGPEGANQYQRGLWKGKERALWWVLDLLDGKVRALNPPPPGGAVTPSTEKPIASVPETGLPPGTTPEAAVTALQQTTYVRNMARGFCGMTGMKEGPEFQACVERVSRRLAERMAPSVLSGGPKELPRCAHCSLPDSPWTPVGNDGLCDFCRERRSR